jgi:hypothetical protein
MRRQIAVATIALAGMLAFWFTPTWYQIPQLPAPRQRCIPIARMIFGPTSTEEFIFSLTSFPPPGWVKCETRSRPRFTAGILLGLVGTSTLLLARATRRRPLALAGA